MNLRYSLLILLSLSSHLLKAQDERLADSLIAFLRTTTVDSTKVRTLNLIAEQYAQNAPDTTIKYAGMALDISNENGFKKGIGAACNWLGQAYRTKGDFAKALEFYDRSIAAYRESNEIGSVAAAMSNSGNIYVDQGNYDKAYERFLTSLEIFNQIGNKPRIAIALANIGVMFQNKAGSTRNTRDYEEALKYHFKAYKMDMELQNKFDISIDLNNIGSVYSDMAKLNPSEATLNKALTYFEDALRLKEEVHDTYGKAIVLVNIADMYIQKGKLRKESELLIAAIVYGKRSLAIFKEVQDAYGEAHTYNKIAQAFGEQNELKPDPSLLDSAVVNFLSGLKVAKSIDAKDLLREIYFGLSEIHELRSDFKEALLYQKLYASIKDTILNEQNTRSMNEMETKYQTAEKDKEITKQQAEAKQKATERNMFIIGFGLMLILAFFIFRSYRQKKKDNLIITEQKKEVEIQKHIIEEKNKDITDSITYARRIQRSLMPTEKHIHRTLDRLKKK